ncbi:MAG: hypothetical protein GEU83_05285 [Pseudonocardiaceae bacterium]|nr:hypothetical protein [Pseudonocardiaceae bacterium]
MDTTETRRNPLDALVPDPTGIPPLCSESDFDELLQQLVADSAPRTFAVVQEYGERVDGRIAAWGLAFDDHVNVVSADDGIRMTLGSADRVRHAFTWGRHITARLVWVDRGEGAQRPLE